MPFLSFAIMLSSLLTAVVVGTWSPLMLGRVAAVFLAVATTGAGLVAMRGRPRAYPVMLVLGACMIGLLAWHLSGSATPLPMRSLHLAAALSWGAVLVASVVRLFRITDWPRALLLGFSVAVPLLIADAFVAPAPPPQGTRWETVGQTDPDVGFRYEPNSVARNFYPDNPRGYFEQTRPDQERWSLETHEGRQARLEFVAAGEAEVVRVTMTSADLPERQAWHVKLQQKPLAVRSGTNYTVSFEARADDPRPVGCSVGQDHPPYESLGVYRGLEVGTAWDRYECPFVAVSSDSEARLFFDLGASDAPVEFRNVAIVDDAGQVVTPPVGPPEFFVSYRFNSLGLRGPDRAIPAPPGTFRIVTLGDSYAMGVGVHEEDTVAAQLERRLNAAAAATGEARVYEVINDGVSGYDTRQERLSFEKYSSQYAPQLVLLLMVFNDDLSYNDEFERGLLPSQSGSGVFNLLGRVNAVRQTRHYDYSGSVDQIRQLHEVTSTQGAKLAVAFFRNSEVEPWPQLVADVTGGLRGTGIPVLDLGRALLDDREGDFRGIMVHAVDGHPNEVAHRFAAEALEPFLRNAGMLEE